MASAAALTLLCFVIFALGNRALPRLQTIGGVAVRAVLLLIPPAARNALALLNCAPTSLSSSGCASLDGCSSDSSSAGGRGSTVSVSLLASNPYYVCWATGGAHAAAGGLAAVVVLLVIIAFPLATLWAVWSRGIDLRKRSPLSGSARVMDGGEASAAIAVVNPMRNTSALGPAQDATLSDAGTSTPPASSPLLGPFISDYRPGAWYTRHADLGVTLLLAALQASCLPSVKIAAA